jgi:23S rRNA (cytidine1920-2'-O)/16S rRNA (cytidine1409-2'-O)-methyltransferase
LAKQRLDALLVNLELCTSRQQAQRLIRAGEVTVNQQLIDKPGTEVDILATIKIKERPPYISRGGEKLAKALTVFAIPVTGRICIDAGISTGGFTDCLLKAGAVRVYGVDVGYGQVDWGLRNDPRLILKERTNFRYLKPGDIYGDLSPLMVNRVLLDSWEGSPHHPQKTQREEEESFEEGGGYADLGVADVSFISLTKILPPLWELLMPPREVVLLVKPQFEVGAARVGKKGVVRSAVDQADAIDQVYSAAQALGWEYRGLTWSPLVGPAGNIEYLLWLRADSPAVLDSPAIASPINHELILKITQAAQRELTNPTSLP